VLECDDKAFTSMSVDGKSTWADGYRDVVTLGFSALPQDEVTITIPIIYLRVRGPWQVRWEVEP
ncbi:MAG: hypothetical protein P1S60_09545, partial [Anaerolineae bacterium]|nr:hypothetical protein [Anaerolineae bacterium]